MLHDLVVVVGLDCIANNVVQALQGSLVGLEVSSDAVLAVQVKGTLRDLPQSQHSTVWPAQRQRVDREG